MTLRTTLAWLPLMAALTALPAMAADMPGSYVARGSAGFSAGWQATPPPPAVAVETP
jgi:hypothetical protein